MTGCMKKITKNKATVMFTCLDEEMQRWDYCGQRNTQFLELQFLDRTEIYMKYEGKEHILIHKQPLCVLKSHNRVIFDRIFTGNLFHV